MTLGSLASVRLDSNLAVRLPERVLKFVVMGLIFIAAILMAFGVKHWLSVDFYGG